MRAKNAGQGGCQGLWSVGGTEDDKVSTVAYSEVRWSGTERQKFLI